MPSCSARSFTSTPRRSVSYTLPFAVGNLLGAVLLGRLFDTVGRKPMIAGTYGIAGLLLFATGLLFVRGSLDAVTITICWSVTFFIASAGASSAYLTASEIFPLEIRASAIALVYSVGTLAGGALGPAFFGALVATKRPAAVFVGYAVAAVLMIAAAMRCNGGSVSKLPVRNWKTLRRRWEPPERGGHVTLATRKAVGNVCSLVSSGKSARASSPRPCVRSNSRRSSVRTRANSRSRTCRCFSRRPEIFGLWNRTWRVLIHIGKPFVRTCVPSRSFRARKPTFRRRGMRPNASTARSCRRGITSPYTSAGNWRSSRDAGWLHAHLCDLTNANEAARDEPWGVDDAPADYLEGMMRGIVGLRMTVTSVQGAWKMAQHRSEADRLGTIEGLAVEPNGFAVANVMRELEVARANDT